MIVEKFARKLMELLEKNIFCRKLKNTKFSKNKVV